MYSGKSNTQIRFYTQPKSSSKANPQSFLKLILSKVHYKKKIPSFFIQDQRHIAQDFRKKTQEIRSLRQRFSSTQRSRQIPQKRSTNIFERLSFSPKRTYRKLAKLKTQLQINQQQPLNKTCLNTIKLQYSPKRGALNPKMQKTVKGLSDFQRNAIKRIKIRQDMILKKKCDSLIHQTQRNIGSLPKDKLFNCMASAERILQYLIFS